MATAVSSHDVSIPSTRITVSAIEANHSFPQRERTAFAGGCPDELRVGRRRLAQTLVDLERF
jgi:hypothetical protein